jgi:hypothetical protein
MVLAFPRYFFEVPRKARAQIAARRKPRCLARGDRDIDRGQAMLIQSERLARHALDEISRHRSAAGARGDRQPQACMMVMICEHGQNEVRIGEPPASLPHHAKLGRLVQSLARLERQLGRTRRNSRLWAEALAALRAAPSKHLPTALGRHPRAKSVRTGAMQITRIEGTFHKTNLRTKYRANQGSGGLAKGGKGTQAGMEVSIDAPRGWS